MVEYLYVEANEGSASGGHTALRLGAEVYHFQHHPGGVLRLHRDSTERFFHAYGLIGNRPIHVSRIAVGDETYARLRRGFYGRTLVESRQFDLLDALRADVELFAALQGSVARAVPRSLRGAGFFFTNDGTPQPTGTPSPALQVLRDRIALVHGADFVDRRLARLEQQIRRLRPQPIDVTSFPPSRDASPHVPTPPFSQQYDELATGLVALITLRDALPLRSGTYHDSQDEALRLRAAEGRAINRLIERQVEDLTRLVASARPDFGFPLLAGMARLAALDLSRRAGRWVLLDTFGDDAVIIERARLRRHAEMLPELLEEAQRQLDVARRHLEAAAEPREPDFTELEAAANRYHELRRAVTQGTDLRVDAGQLLPSRPAWINDLVTPDLSAAEVTRALEQTTATERVYGAWLQRLHRYHLITHNCVSEIFHVINQALAPHEMGGHIDPAGALHFIPFASARAVNGTYPVIQTFTTAPYRHLRLAEMYEHEDNVWAYLRESNTLTSTVYRRGRDDSVFLFFTDDALLLRPLFGAVNVGVGLAASAYGLLALPLSGADNLRSGLKGVLFSLPELTFVNIRKGSFDYVPQKYRQRPSCVAITATPDSSGAIAKSQGGAKCDAGE